MRYKSHTLLFVFCSLIVCDTLFAERGAQSPTETIPFITYQENLSVLSLTEAPMQSVPRGSEGSNNQAPTYCKNSLVDNVPTKNLEDLLVKIKRSVCRSTGSADIKVWFSSDASGKVLGVGAAAQSGLEVTFHCK